MLTTDRVTYNQTQSAMTAPVTITPCPNRATCKAAVCWRELALVSATSNFKEPTKCQ